MVEWRTGQGNKGQGLEDMATGAGTCGTVEGMDMASVMTCDGEEVGGRAAR